MENAVNNYQTDVIKRNFKSLKVIVTNSTSKIANIGFVTEVQVVKNLNDLILEITGDKKTVGEGFYIKSGETYYKICFKIVSSDISLEILNSYMACYNHKVKTSYEVFDFVRNQDSLKQVKAFSQEKFLSWYSSGRRTEKTISEFDGVWISGQYIKFMPVIPPSIEFTIAEVLFTRFNMQNKFTSVGSYKFYVPSENEDLWSGHYDSFTTINGIVMPDVISFVSITNDELIVIDKDGEKYSIYSNQEEVSIQTA